MTVTDLEVLEANDAFYRAFAAADVAAMERVWSERHPSICIHPGWDVLRGRGRILASWRSILGSDDSPEISCSHVEVHVLGEVAFVTCQEALEGGRLAATNVFAREDGGWRMVLHQASPIAPGQARPSPPSGPAN